MLKRIERMAVQNENKTTEDRTHEHDENCRCKETSKMTPQELLKLMVSDLAFWKKLKKDE